MTPIVQWPTRCGITLIEVMAVLIILGITTAVLLGMARPFSETHQRLVAISITRTAIDQSRAHAVSGAVDVMLMGKAGHLQLEWSNAQRELRRAYLPAGWKIQIALRGASGQANSALQFDPLGCTSDAEIALTSPSGTATPLVLHGLSGFVNVPPAGGSL